MKLENYKISVVLPIRNDAEFCVEAINSVMNQTHKNVELILINDGSTDNTQAVIEDFARKDNRIVLMQNKKSLGLPAALNRGIAAATGQFVARMDSDDVCSLTRFERQLTFLISQKLDVVGCAVSVETPNGVHTRKYPETGSDCNFALLFESCFCHPAILGKREHFLKHRYDELLTTSQDYDLWCRMAQSGLRLGNTPEKLFTYRERSNSHSARSSVQKERIARQVQAAYAEQMLASKTLPSVLTRFRFATDKPSVRDAKELLDQLSAEKIIEESLLTMVERKLFYVSPKSLTLYAYFLRFQKARFGAIKRVGLLLLGLSLFRVDIQNGFVAKARRIYSSVR